MRAIDRAGNPDPTPASRSFTVEALQQEHKIGPRTPLDSVIRKGMVNQAKNTATFRFSSTEPGSAFLCKLDRKPFRGWTSPKIYRHLKPGKHRFRVETLDSAGDLDPTPPVRAFKIKP